MRTLALNIHSRIYKMRKVIILILLGLCLKSVLAKQPIVNFGLEAKLNSANQMVHNPQNIASETYHWESLNGIGANSFLEFQPNRIWKFTGRFGYNQKGFIQEEQTVFKVINNNKIEAPITSTESHKNKFHYLNLDAVVKYNLGKKMIIPFLETGLRANYLIAEKRGSADLFKISGNQFYNYKDYKKFAMGLIAGLGICYENKIFLLFETDIDLSKSVNTTDLSVKNRVFSVILGVNINQLFRYN